MRWRRVARIVDAGERIAKQFAAAQDRDSSAESFGISDDDGRLMVVITYNSDLGDAWEWMDRPCYPEKYSGQAYRMGLNFMIYAMSH